MKKLLSVAILCLTVIIAASVAAPAAKAATITAVWTGTVRDGFDYGNSFGGFSAGDGVVLTTVFDTSLGTLAGNTITGGGTATLSINGNDHVFNLTPSSYGINAFGVLEMAMGDIGGYKVTASFYPSSALPGSILQSFSGTCYAVTYCGGEFQIVPGWTTGVFDLATLNVTVAATPIPAALPLFASALGGLGFIARRRKMAKEAAAA